jgi:hypothetical protein
MATRKGLPLGAPLHINISATDGVLPAVCARIPRNPHSHMAEVVVAPQRCQRGMGWMLMAPGGETAAATFLPVQYGRRRSASQGGVHGRQPPPMRAWQA